MVFYSRLITIGLELRFIFYREYLRYVWRQNPNYSLESLSPKGMKTKPKLSSLHHRATSDFISILYNLRRQNLFIIFSHDKKITS